MGVLCMWLGMAAFLFSVIFANIAKNQQRQLQKLGKPPDASYKKTRLAAKLLFAAGISLLLFGTILTIGTGGS